MFKKLNPISRIDPKIKSIIGYVIKIALIMLGLADFFGILPPSLDVFDKLLTTILLLYFWYVLKPSKFMFGKRSKFIDASILFGFYLMTLYVYTRFFETYNLFFQNIIQLFADNVSLISVIGSLIVITAISLYVSIWYEFKEKSVVHSFFFVFYKDIDFWKKLSNLKNKLFIPLRFALAFITLYIIGNYFFLLVSQWFIVSLDKSLLVVAVIFAVKDLKSKNIEAINKIGEFDDYILGTITKLFTDYRYFYLGLGFLLIFHYLSDISIFFLPYLTHFIPMEQSYYSLNPNTHQSLFSHFQTESFLSLYQELLINWVYIFAGLGILVIIMIPIILMFFIVFKIELRGLEKKLYYLLPLIIFITAIAVFICAPWAKQIPIIGGEGGVYGVDFISQKISDVTFFSFQGIFIISVVVLIISGIAVKRGVSEFLAITAYITSMTYFGLYAWNFFVSSNNFYSTVIEFFIKEKMYVFLVNFQILAALDFFFYVGVFIMLSYFLSQYVLKNVVHELMNNKFIIAWVLVILSISIFIISLIGPTNLHQMSAILFSFLITTLLFNLAFYKKLSSKTEFRDDFILATNIVILMYLTIGIITLLISLIFGVGEGILNFSNPIIVFAISLVLLKVFNLKMRFDQISIKKIGISIILGIIFGLLFIFANEPLTPIFTDNFFIIIIFLVFIAASEEIIFRLLLFKLTERSFNYKLAIIMQGLVFSIIHFLFFKDILFHYSGSLIKVFLYFILLFVFSIAMGLLVGKEEAGGEKDLLYPIIAHFIADLMLYLIL